MKIDVETVKAITQLSKLRFDEREIGDFVSQFAEIVEFVEKLSEVDTTMVELLPDSKRIDSMIQADQVSPGLKRSEALANAPKSDGEFFIVPKVIADE